MEQPGFLWVFYSSVMPQVKALLCLTKLEIVPLLFYTGPDFGFTLELLQLIPITCRAKSNGMEKALDDSDLKSPQNGAAAQHWSHSKATLPLLGEAWRGKISLEQRLGLVWGMAQILRHHWRKCDGKNGFSSTGGAKSFHINDHQGFVLGADVPGTTETAPGSCKVYKKITLETAQIGII